MHKALNSILSTETNRRGNTHELMVVYLIFNPTMSLCYYLAPIPPYKIPWTSKLKTFSKLHGKTVCSLRLCDLYVLWSGWTPVSEAGELLLVSCIKQQLQRRKKILVPMLFSGWFPEHGGNLDYLLISGGNQGWSCSDLRDLRSCAWGRWIDRGEDEVVRNTLQADPWPSHRGNEWSQNRWCYLWGKSTEEQGLKISDSRNPK